MYVFVSVHVTSFRIDAFLFKNKCVKYVVNEGKIHASLSFPNPCPLFKMLNLPFRVHLYFQSILSPVAKHNAKNRRLSRGVYCVCSPPGTVLTLSSAVSMTNEKKNGAFFLSLCVYEVGGSGDTHHNFIMQTFVSFTLFLSGGEENN